MVENWKQTDTMERKFSIDVDKATHEASGTAGRGHFPRRFGVAHVGIRYTRVVGEDWQGPRVTLVTGGGLHDPVLRMEDLSFVPEWLEDMIARSRPVDP